MNAKQLIITIITTTTAAVLSAQSHTPTDSTALRLAAEGKTWLAQNEFKKAEAAFRSALQKDANLTAAMSGLGEVSLAKQDWGDANDWYEKILDHEP
ncbi:MAG: hypothetical protein ACREOI_35340, partial [bacterium]